MASEEILNSFVDGQELVKLFRSPKDGRVYAKRRPAEYSMFLRREDVGAALLRDLKGSVVIRGVKDEGAFLRCSFTSFEARQGYCSHPESPLVQEGIETFEGDVDPVRRHFTDGDVKIAPPRRCYLDIETDSRVSFADKEEMRVLTWAVVAHDTGERWSGCLEAFDDRSERELLVALWAALDPFDQVVGWYLDGFDAPVIFARSKLHKIRTDARRWLWLDQLEVVKKFHHGGDGDEKRSMRLEDMGQALTGRGKLKAPGWVTERFGDRSMGELSYELWEAGGEFRKLLVDYNVQDTDLLRAIEQKTGYLNLFDAVCRVCRLFATTASLQNTHQMDGYMLRLGLERGYRFRTKRFHESVKFKGAFVMQPATLDAGWRAQHGMQDGISRSVHVCDFSSMYPSIIMAWNMSPDTKVAGAINGPIEPGTCRTPLTGVCFKTDVEGILPAAIRELSKLRQEWNDRKATLAPGSDEWVEAGHLSQAYKVVVLAFYGVMGSVFSRFFDKGIAESVTQAGVWLIKQTMHAAEQRGYQVIYGDTDSLFVTGPTRVEFASFVRWCNEELYPGLLVGQGCRPNDALPVKLAYEKEFERLVMTSAKRYVGSMRHFKWTTSCSCTTAKGNPGALDVKTMRCRDCGVVHESLPPVRGEPEIKGLEYRRGDALKMAADLQAHAIDLLVGGMGIAERPVPTESLEDYHAVLSRVRQRILEQPIEIADVKLSKALSKPLKEYVTKQKLDGQEAAQPPHVQIAKILKQRGQDVREGTRVDYFVADGAASPMKVLPAEDWAGSCDRFYLWEDLVWPPTLRLLEAAFPGHDWAAWTKVRPPKVRSTKATRASADQSDMFGAVQPGRASSLPAKGATPDPGVGQRTKAPRSPDVAPGRVRVVVDEQCCPGGAEGALREVRAVLERHPGDQPVDLLVRLRSGGSAELGTALRARSGPGLDEELRRFRIGG